MEDGVGGSSRFPNTKLFPMDQKLKPNSSLVVWKPGFENRGRLRFVSLKTKMIFSIVLLSVLTTGILGTYLVFRSYRSLREQAQQSQLALAKALAWEVDQGLSQACQTIEKFSKQNRILQLQKENIVREMTLISTSTEFIDALLYFKADGTLLAGGISTIPKRDFPSASFVKLTLEKSKQLRHSVLVDVYTGAYGHIEIAISAPVIREGKPVGAIVGIMNLPNHAIGNLYTIRIGESGFAYLVNQDGIAIIHPNRGQWLRDLSQIPSVMAFKKNKEGFIQFINAQGEDILSAFALVKTSGWGVVVRQPASECYESANNMLKVTILFILATVAFSFFVSLFLADKVAKPILELVEQIRQHESGKFGSKSLVNIEPSDEVDILKQAIGRMANTIRSQTLEREKSYQRELKAERKASVSERLATVGQLSAGLAHELNNPLAVILGAARMASGAEKKEQKKWLAEIHEEAERCRRLVADLLNFAKPLRLRLRQSDLGGLAVQSWEKVPKRDASFHLETVPRFFQARVDPDRFQQVFINLFRNALEAMPQSGKVKVLFHKRGNRIRVQVTDQGKGIHPKNKSQLFRPFFTTKPGGTGLGLPIVRSILQAHNGKISVGPNRPHGVKITLEWPKT